MMTKVKTFFHVFSNSLLPKSVYYRKILKSRFIFSLSYFFILIILLNGFLALIMASKISPFKIKSVLTDLESSLQTYPRDLTVTIKNGEVQTTYDRPYFFWFDYNQSKNLIAVVDQTADPKKIKEYNSFVLLTQKGMFFQNNELPQGYSSVNLTNLNNITINKGLIEEVRNTVDKINHVVIFFYPLAFLLVLLLLIFSSLVSTFLYLFIATGIVYIVYLFVNNRTKLKFLKMIQLSLHSISLPLLLNYFSGVLGFKSVILPLLFLFLIIVFVASGIYAATEQTHIHKKRS